MYLYYSMDCLICQGVRLFGNEDVKCVRTSVGPEQEYFLIDKEMYDQRRDLRFTGRTLFGAKPPKGQEMDDHYFGVIKPRVAAFMEELNEELWKLGILAKTEHNEVAPAQHELAPIYTTTNIATDHNQSVAPAGMPVISTLMPRETLSNPNRRPRPSATAGKMARRKILKVTVSLLTMVGSFTSARMVPTINMVRALLQEPI